MLSQAPPGYYSGSLNRQTVRGLGAPGLQSQPVTPGANRLSAASLQPSIGSPSGMPGLGASVPGSSSYSMPSSMPAQSPPPMMNGYNNSSNRSTLIRTLLGKI